jgi:hypothetical protein
VRNSGCKLHWLAANSALRWNRKSSTASSKRSSCSGLPPGEGGHVDLGVAVGVEDSAVELFVEAAELLISTDSAGSHLVHGRCIQGAIWSSAQVAEPGEWASLVELGERGHALIKQRGTKFDVSCGALSAGRWRHDAGSTVTVSPPRKLHKRATCFAVPR